MANLNDLPLNPDTIPDVVVEEQPVLGSSVLPPQPGTYVFRIASEQAIFNCFATDETADQGQRLRAQFRDEAALYNETLGEQYNTNISNRVRYVKQGDQRVAVSDMAMVLNAVGVYPEVNTNAGYGEALVKAAGKRFKADHTLTAKCNPMRNIYKDGAEVPGVKGCGWQYAVEGYTKNDGTKVLPIPRDEDGKASLRFSCANPKCSAEVRAWGQLRGFRSAD